MDGEGFQEGVPAASTRPEEGTPRRVKYFVIYLSALLLDALLLYVALAFPRHSLAYEWINRVGIFLAVVILAGLFIWAEWGSTRPYPDLQGRPGLRWYMRAVGVLLPALVTFKLWNRILDAFWLR
jgi:hypothetical protein